MKGAFPLVHSLGIADIVVFASKIIVARHKCQDFSASGARVKAGGPSHSGGVR